MTTKHKYNSHDLFRDHGDLSFGEILRGFRLSDELSQIEFAKKLDISPANLCDLEKGRKIPGPLRAIRIARKLGLSETFLLQVALQDILRREKIKYRVTIEARAS
jgi:transcriptional regulator with XRE-family HTH domain